LLVDRAKELKQTLAKETTELFRSITKNRIPTSHFFINKEYEKFLYSLELNYFVSKYYEQADRDGVVISIYSINFGLCREQNINFSRPQGDTKYRKYYISRHFNYDRILQQYLLEQKTFVCESCGMEYPYSEAELLNKIGMLCYKGCKVAEVKEEYKFKDANLLNGMNTENLLPEIELDILHVLSQDKKAQLYASLIARELDCSHQLVTKRTQKLKSADLIEQSNVDIDGKNRKVYDLTEKAEQLYFNSQGF
jgi:DNA-binding MarR family transcriptional regulator